jgi:hypothetical protein
MDEQPTHLTENEARAGSEPHMARYALGWGLLLVIIAFLIVLFVTR